MLTDREIKVLRLSAEGRTQVEIARALSVSQPAVSKFLNNARRKIKDAEEVMRTAKGVGAG